MAEQENQRDVVASDTFLVLRGFDVQEASALEITDVGVTTSRVVRCRLDTVEAPDATRGGVASTVHDILVTPEVAGQLAHDLYDIAHRDDAEPRSLPASGSE